MISEYDKIEFFKPEGVIDTAFGHLIEALEAAGFPDTTPIGQKVDEAYSTFLRDLRLDKVMDRAIDSQRGDVCNGRR